MIIIPINKTTFRRIQITVNEDPTPGTWGDYLLMKKDLEKQELEALEVLGPDDAELMKRPHFRQMLFNYEWLKGMLEKHGELHCEYCGKQHLKLTHWREKPNKHIIATTDHYLSKKTHPHLARIISNLRVSCHNCNNNKKSETKECKFPYPEHIKI
jgi:hypothetical protein